MNINFNELFENMLAAGTAAAKGHASDLEAYLEARARLIANGIVQLAADRRDPQNPITDDDVKFEYEQIKAEEQTALIAINVTLKLAAQDAINAALGVAKEAINTALGVTVI